MPYFWIIRFLFCIALAFLAASCAIEEVKFIGIFFDGDFRSAVALPVNCLFPSGGGGGGGGGAGGTGATEGVGAFCLVSLAKGGF